MKRSLQEKIMMRMFAFTAIFIIVAFVFEYFSGSTTKIFNVKLKDTTTVEVLIITSSPYNKSDWRNIIKIVERETTKSSDVRNLKTTILLRLTNKQYKIVALNIARNITIIYNGNGSQYD